MTTRRVKHRWQEVVVSTGSLCGALLLWQLFAAGGVLDPFFFPPPSKLIYGLRLLLSRGYPEGTDLLAHISASLSRVCIGFSISAVLGILFGLAIGWFPKLEAMASPVITLCRGIPAIALVPLAITWFGIGETAKIFVVAYGCFWIMITSTIAGVRYVDPVLVRVAQSLDTRGWRLFFGVILPAALPRIFAGLRIGLGFAYMVLLAAEMVATVKGLGALIEDARRFFRTDITLDGMLLIGILGALMSWTMARIERRLLRWHVGI